MDFLEIIQTQIPEFDKSLIEVLRLSQLNTLLAFQGIEIETEALKNLFVEIEDNVRNAVTQEAIMQNINWHGKEKSIYQLTIGEKMQIKAVIQKVKNGEIIQIMRDVEKIYADVKQKMENDRTFTDQICKLLETSQRNDFLLHFEILKGSIGNERACTGNRFCELLKKIFAYIKLKSSNGLYQFLYHNDIIPSASTAAREQYKIYQKMVIGEIYVDELLKFLTERSLPLSVGISEDATRVKSQINFDLETKQLIGLVTPCSANGLPDKNQLIASTPADIIEKIKSRPKANCIQTIVATPYVKGFFCLNLKIKFYLK